MAVSEAVLKIRLTWDPPSNPRGIVTRYRVSLIAVHVQAVLTCRIYIDSRVVHVSIIVHGKKICHNYQISLLCDDKVLGVYMYFSSGHDRWC